MYRVHRILPQTISSVKLPEAPDVYSLYRKAHKKLYQLWKNKNNNSDEEKWWEIFRLLFANKDNPDRFRQGFSLMLEFGWDYVFIDQLRQLKDDLLNNELPQENYCSQLSRLEDYLNQGYWKDADVETTWIFYLVYLDFIHFDSDFYAKDWYDFCANFPSELFQEINELWGRYSNGHFGFSIQKSIWESVVKDNGYEKYGTLFWDIDESELDWTQYTRWWGEEDDQYFEYEDLKQLELIEVRRLKIDKVEELFGKRVGWTRWKWWEWEQYNSINFSIEATQAGFFPYLATCRSFRSLRDFQPSCDMALPDSSIYILLYMRADSYGFNPI